MPEIYAAIGATRATAREQIEEPYSNGSILYVASTGSDTNDGSATSPLASVREAFRRLEVRKWEKYARVRVLDNVSINAVSGALQEYNVPTPIAGAYPVLLEGVLTDSGLGEIAPTGGTNIVTTPTANATVTTALVGLGVDAYKGMILSFANTDSASWNGVNRTIISNTANGTFTLAGQLPGAPNAGKKFTIKTQVSQLTCGTTQVNWRNNVLLIDSLKIEGGVHTFEKCFVQYSRTAWAANASGMYVQGWESTLYDGTGSGNAIAIYDFGGALTGGGNYWNGAASASVGITIGGGFTTRWSYSGWLNFAATGIYLRNVKLVGQLQGQTINCFFRGWSRWEEPTITMQPQSRLILDRMVMTSPKATISLTGGYAYPSWINVSDATGAFYLFTASQGQQLIMYQLTGANPLAQGVVSLSTGAEVHQLVASTLTGGASFNSVHVGSDPGISFAQLNTLGGSVKANDSSHLMQFSGGYAHTGVNATSYFAAGTPSTSAFSTVLLRTPVSPARRALTLRVKPITNTLTGSATATVFKNGVATGITVTIPAGSTALVSDTTNTEVFASGDSIDLGLATTGANATSITFTATLRLA